MERASRGRGATIVAVLLAAGWLAAAAFAHAPLVVPLVTDRVPPEHAGLTFLFRGTAALLFVDVPAVVAGAAAVGATRWPGVPRSRRVLAKAAFAAALTGPVEAVAVLLLRLALPFPP
jgi:hypothetical protein